MKYFIDQRYTCCDRCAHFRDSLIEGRKACNEHGCAFSPDKPIVDDTCEDFITVESYELKKEMYKKFRKK